MSNRVKAGEVRDALMKKMQSLLAENKGLRMAAQDDYINIAAKTAEGFWHLHNRAKSGDVQAIVMLTRWQAVQQEIFDTDYSKFMPKPVTEKIEVARETGAVAAEDKILEMRKEAEDGLRTSEEKQAVESS